MNRGLASVFGQSTGGGLWRILVLMDSRCGFTQGAGSELLDNLDGDDGWVFFEPCPGAVSPGSGGLCP